MLASVRQLLEENKTVYILGERGEFEVNVRRYFNEYTPFFFNNTDYRVQVVQEKDLYDKDIYYITMDDAAVLPGHTLVQKFINESNLYMLSAAKCISSFVLRSKNPFSWIDAGTSRIGTDNWYIYKNTLNLDDYRSTAKLLYRTDKSIEVPGGKPYAECFIDIPKTLEKNHIFIIKLTYHTTGNANPYVIVPQTPSMHIDLPLASLPSYQYKRDWIPLCNKIPLSTSSKTMELPFSPVIDVLSPRILLRNAAPEGTFVIEEIEVSEITLETAEISP
jgi:hypothetical protein